MKSQLLTSLCAMLVLSASARAEQQIFEPIKIRDPGLNNLVSHELLIPQGWQVSGGVYWNPAAYQNFVSVHILVFSPDGSQQMQVLPIQKYQYSEAYSNYFPVGQVIPGGTIWMPPMDGVDVVTQTILPRLRPNAYDIQVLGTTSYEEMIAHYQRLFALITQNLNNGLIQFQADYYPQRVRVQYSENGLHYEEDFYFTLLVSRQFAQGIDAYDWWVFDARAMRTIAGQLDQALPLLTTISTSVHTAPKWQAIISHLSLKIAQGWIKHIGRIAQEAYQHADQLARDNARHYAAQQAEIDRGHEQYIDYIRGIDTYKDAAGNSYRIPDRYQHVWTNNYGMVLASTDALQVETDPQWTWYRLTRDN